MKICDILGVEHNEVFEFNGDEFYISDEGYLWKIMKNGSLENCRANNLSEIIENKSAIRIKNNFSDDELAVIRLLKKCGNFKLVKRSGKISLHESGAGFNNVYNPDEILSMIFRSLHKNDCIIDLDEIYT